MNKKNTRNSKNTAQRLYFTEGRSEIAADNLATMKVIGLLGTVSCLFFFCITPIIMPQWSVTKEYLLIIPVLLFTFLFGSLYGRKGNQVSPALVETVCVLIYFCLLAAFIALSVFPYPDNPQIFISLCFMFMPVILIMKPVFVVATMTVAEAVFLYLAIKYKTQFAWENDIFNTIASIAFSLIILMIINRLRAKNFHDRLKLEILSRTDALTGLLNKKVFEDKSDAYVTTMQNESRYALLVFDVDNFKYINDTYGHPFGDVLLERVGSLLLNVFRQTDLVGRIGGDEFAVLMLGNVNPTLIELKKKVLAELFNEIDVSGVNPQLTVSVGVALVNGDVNYTYKDMFEMADKELYKAKAERKAQAPQTE